MASNAAVAALLKPTKQNGRNAFPLDNKQVYSMKAGQITPVKCFHYEPDSYLDIKAHDFTLTFPMQTAPFLRGRKETSFYSVYYNAIWSLFNQYQGTRNDPKTSAFGQSPNLVEPRFPLVQFYGALMSQWFYYFFYTYYIDFYVDYTYQDSDDVTKQVYKERIKDNFFKTSFEQPFNIVVTYREINSNDDRQVSLIYADLFPYMMNYNFYNPKTGTGILNSQDFITIEEYCCDVVGHFRVYNWIRKLDMLGYGNRYGDFNSIEKWLIDTMQNFDMSSQTLSYWHDYHFVPNVNNLYQGLFDSVVTYDPEVIGDLTPSRSDVVMKMVNLYPICGYNSVFYHFFRNSFYDLDYYTHDYSLDFVSVDTSHGDFNVCHINDFSLRFFDIEYHQWKKDTFTGVLPDTQFGAVSSISLSGSINDVTLYGDTFISQSRSLSNNDRLDQSGVGSAPNFTASSSSNWFAPSGTPLTESGRLRAVVSGSVPGGGSFDVIALKRAEMLQEYRQQLMRAGNRTSDVFKAIYGKAPSSEHEDDVIPRFLETFGEDIFVDPVQSTANTGDGNPNGQLGDIAARGKFRGDSPEIEFKSGGNFGVIIAFTYVVPTAEYNSYLFDKHIFELTPEDHYIPNFENLGLEPIMSDELNCLFPANDIKVLGYGPRYYHKKSEIDLVHGAFCSRPYYKSGSPVSTFGWFGDFNNWVSPRSDMQNRQVTSVRDFYINPSVLDNVFVRAAGADQADDQFICNTYFECNAVKAMSKIGLINFV